MVIKMSKIFEVSPSGLRSLPPARGSCAPAPCAAHHQSQTPPVYQHQMIAVDHLLGDGGGDGGDDGGEMVMVLSLLTPTCIGLSGMRWLRWPSESFWQYAAINECSSFL